MFKALIKTDVLMGENGYVQFLKEQKQEVSKPRQWTYFTSFKNPSKLICQNK